MNTGTCEQHPYTRNPYTRETTPHPRRTPLLGALSAVAAMVLSGCVSAGPETTVQQTVTVDNVNRAYDTPYGATEKAVCDTALELGKKLDLPEDMLQEECEEATDRVIEGDTTRAPHDVTGDKLVVTVVKSLNTGQFTVTAEQLEQTDNG